MRGAYAADPYPARTALVTQPDDLTIKRARRYLTAGRPAGPAPSPCVCGADQHEHTGRRRAGRCTRTGCRRFRLDPAYTLALAALEASGRDAAADLALDHARRRPPRDPNRVPRVRPSDAGKCGRAISYRELQPEGLFLSPTDKGAANTGTLIHDGVEAARRRLYPWQRYSMPISIPGFEGVGEIDRYDPVTGRVTDLKTAGSWRWEQFSSGPTDADWAQVDSYAYGLDLAGYHVTEVEIEAYNRERGGCESFVRPYDKARSLQVLDGLMDRQSALDRGELMDRDEPGPSTSYMCRALCEFRDYCWDTATAAAAGRSPESWDLLGDNYRDDPVTEWALEQVYAATRANSAADRNAKAAKALVEGLEPGVYGSMELTFTRGSWRTDYKRWVELLLRLVGVPADQLPAPDAYQFPPKSRTAPSYGARPVREAKKPKKKTAAGERPADPTEGISA